MKRLFLLLLAAGAMAAAPHSKATPRPAPTATAATVGFGVWTVHASSLDFNWKNGDFSTPDKVYVTRPGGDITADRMSGNQKTKKVTFYGHVVAHDTQGGFAAFANSSPEPAGGPSTLTSDQLDVDGAGKIYTATGHVHYVHNDTTMDSQRATLNDATHTLYLDGDVHLVQGDRNLVASSVVYDTITDNAKASGDVVMQFPGQVNPRFATPKPIKVPSIPFQKHRTTPAPPVSPSPSPT
jgi:lipopolysaccharide export system protein LptA